MERLTGEQIWLLLAERGEPMSAEEIAKELCVEERLVQDILRQEPSRFQPEIDGRWGLTAWHVPYHCTFVAKAELILWFARCPVPENIFLQLLQKVHNWISEKQMLQVLKSRNRFIFKSGYWSLQYPKEMIEDYVQKLMKNEQQRIYELLSNTEKPLSIFDLKEYIELNSRLENFSREHRLNDTEQAYLQQLADSYLLHLISSIEGIVSLPSGRWIAFPRQRLQRITDHLRHLKNGLTVEEILRSVLMVKADINEINVIISHLEHYLKDCDQLECINGKWFYKPSSFVSHYTFYDPTTFIVVVEKGEHIKVGTEKERWLKEKGFYELARFGGEVGVISD